MTIGIKNPGIELPITMIGSKINESIRIINLIIPGIYLSFDRNSINFISMKNPNNIELTRQMKKEKLNTKIPNTKTRIKYTSILMKKHRIWVKPVRVGTLN